MVGATVVAAVVVAVALTAAFAVAVAHMSKDFFGETMRRNGTESEKENEAGRERKRWEIVLVILFE